MSVLSDSLTTGKCLKFISLNTSTTFSILSVSCTKYGFSIIKGFKSITYSKLALHRSSILDRGNSLEWKSVLKSFHVNFLTNASSIWWFCLLISLLSSENLKYPLFKLLPSESGVVTLEGISALIDSTTFALWFSDVSVYSSISLP